MQGYACVKVYVDKNGRRFFLDLPDGATWQDCADAALEFAVKFQEIRDKAQAQQSVSPESTEPAPTSQE